jgi:hypothetical protein
MTRDMADQLLEYLTHQTQFLDSLDGPLPDQGAEKRTAFSHN